MDRYTFRGKRKNDGQWVTGFLSVVGYDWLILEEGSIDVDFAVDHKTVGQCTGVTDRNGNLIYEGDIVTIGESNGVVGFIGPSFQIHDFTTNINLGVAFAGPDGEIIGNIHDSGA